MAVQTIRHGVFSYTGGDGKETTAYANQTVDIPVGADVTRGQAAGAFWPGGAAEANAYRKSLNLPYPSFAGGIANLPV
jgi:hypothetical protein